MGWVSSFHLALGGGAPLTLAEARVLSAALTAAVWAAAQAAALALRLRKWLRAKHDGAADFARREYSTTQYVSFPIFSLCVATDPAKDREFAVVAGGGGGIEYGFPNRIEAFEMSSMTFPAPGAGAGPQKTAQLAASLTTQPLVDSIRFAPEANLLVGCSSARLRFFRMAAAAPNKARFDDVGQVDLSRVAAAAGNVERCAVAPAGQFPPVAIATARGAAFLLLPSAGGAGGAAAAAPHLALVHLGAGEQAADGRASQRACADLAFSPDGSVPLPVVELSLGTIPPPRRKVQGFRGPQNMWPVLQLFVAGKDGLVRGYLTAPEAASQTPAAGAAAAPEACGAPIQAPAACLNLSANGADQLTVKALIVCRGRPADGGISYPVLVAASIRSKNASCILALNFTCGRGGEARLQRGGVAAWEKRVPMLNCLALTADESRLAAVSDEKLFVYAVSPAAGAGSAAGGGKSAAGGGGRLVLRKRGETARSAQGPSDMPATGCAFLRDARHAVIGSGDFALTLVDVEAALRAGAARSMLRRVAQAVTPAALGAAATLLLARILAP